MAELFQFVLMLLLCLAGLPRFILWIESHRLGERVLRPSEDPASQGLLQDAVPTVLIQIPVYNDAEALRSQLSNLTQIDWPRESLEIQILDDSNDGSGGLIQGWVSELRSEGVPVTCLQRTHRKGFKAGALASGLRQSHAPFVAIFDADFQIPADFLRRTIPAFEDSSTGLVQCRWGFSNREENMLTRVQARLLDAHFHIEHRARSRAGRFFNFNGTAGVWRRAAITEAGGWSDDTVVEDTDLSLRAWRCGWKFIYRDDVICEGHLPTNFRAFRTQQRRWTAGAMQLFQKEKSRARHSSLWADLDIQSRFLTTLACFALVLLTMCAPLRRIYPELLGSDPRWWPLVSTPIVEIPFLFFAVLFVVFYYGSTGGRWQQRVVESFFILILGTGMAFYTCGSLLEGLLGRVSTFERTPKSAVSSGGRSPTGWEYLYFLVITGLFLSALQEGFISVLPLLGMTMVGLLWSFLSFKSKISASTTGERGLPLAGTDLIS